MTLGKLFGTKLPIVQAPMAGAQGVALASAVSNAGGLGSLPCALLKAEDLRKELTGMRAQTDGPFNANFFCHAPAAPSAESEARWREALAPYLAEFGIDRASVSLGPRLAPFGPEALEVLREARPAVVSFHFGLPSAELLAGVRATGAAIMSTATTVDEARWLEARGVDAIIAQGLDAGGHRGTFLGTDLNEQLGTFALLPQVVRAVKLPVIAAGGIADAQGVAAALALGAAGVQVGTAYLLCPEATVNETYRAALKSPDARHTAVTNVFSGRPARAIANRIVKEIGPVCDAAPAFPLALAGISALRAKAEASGSWAFSPVWCGQNAAGCKEVPAAQLTQELAARVGAS